MPNYRLKCERGHSFDRFVPLSQFKDSQYCECGAVTARVICAPLFVSTSEDVRYASPIDGRVISSHAARQEDLKRNNCIPYDPEVKTDYARRIKDSEAQLSASVSETVERTIEHMPTQTRARLYSELTSTEGASHG